MILKICEDREYIASVLTDEEMWERISDDTQYVEDFLVDSIKANWMFIKFTTADGPIGVYCLHPLNGTTWKIHAHILEPFREKYAVEAGKAMMEWMAMNLPQSVLKINAEIPVIFKDVYKFALKHGFQDEGINRKSFRIHGEIVDQYRLGITREELYSWVQSAI